MHTIRSKMSFCVKFFQSKEYEMFINMIEGVYEF